VYLSGLSDGGTFSYLVVFLSGLFSGVAPIAGELSPIADPMLRQKQSKDTPFFVVHGAERLLSLMCAPVRSSCELLQKIGYNLTYTELPEWGMLHLLLNEQLVMPGCEPGTPKQLHEETPIASLEGAGDGRLPAHG